MSLDNIQLHPGLVQDLYRKTLVELDSTQPTTEILNSNKISFLGKNEKYILLIVNEKDTAYLPDEDLNFLLGILTACKLTMADVALANYQGNPGMEYNKLMKQFQPHIIVFYGIEPSLLQFPLQFPHYQLQKYNQQTFLSAPSLKVLSREQEEKKQLWASLKTLFSIN